MQCINQEYAGSCLLAKIASESRRGLQSRSSYLSPACPQAILLVGQVAAQLPAGVCGGQWAQLKWRTCGLGLGSSLNKEPHLALRRYTDPEPHGSHPIDWRGSQGVWALSSRWQAGGRVHPTTPVLGALMKKQERQKNLGG